MVIDKQKKAINLTLRKMLMAIIFASLVILILFSGWFDKPVLGIEKLYWVIIVSALYLIYILIMMIRELHYVFYSDQGNRIVLRFYSLSPFTRRKSSIEIPKSLLGKYEYRKSWLGLKKHLILYQKVKGTLARFTPVSITSLTPAERKQVLASLERWTRES